MTRARARTALPALLLAVVLTACAGAPAGRSEVPSLHPDVDVLDHTTVTITTATGDAVAIRARVATTRAQRSRGLQHVPELPDGVGMLFLFGDERAGGFWMKDTLVPLDIAFVDAAGRIVSVLAMEPCEREPCPRYRPSSPYQAALEVRLGWLAEHGVDVGDTVTWADPLPAAGAEPPPASIQGLGPPH